MLTVRITCEYYISYHDHFLLKNIKTDAKIDEYFAQVTEITKQRFCNITNLIEVVLQKIAAFPNVNRKKISVANKQCQMEMQLEVEGNGRYHH